MITLTRKAKKFLGKLKQKESDQLWERIRDLENNPRPNDSEHVTGYPDCFRITVGEFRVIYGFDPIKRPARQERVPAKRAFPDPKSLHNIKVVVVDRKNDRAAYKKLKTVMGRG